MSRTLTVMATDRLDAGAWREVSPALATARSIVTLGLFGGPALVGGVVLALRAPATVAFGFAIAAVVIVALAIRAARRAARAWAYREDADELVIRSGVLVRRVVTVPYGRLQLVDVTSGPLARRFGFASVQLHTAAATTNAWIPGLPASEAEQLRGRLTARGEAQAAGL